MEPKHGNSKDCLDIELLYNYQDPGDKDLSAIVSEVLAQCREHRLAESTTELYKRIYGRLLDMAMRSEGDKYTARLRKAFLEDSLYRAEGEQFCKSRYELHRRCIQLIDSYLATGTIDLSANTKRNEVLLSDKFMDYYKSYLKSIKYLSQNTQSGYLRLVKYFLKYLQNDMKYDSLADIKRGDVGIFITKVVKEHYHTGLSGVLPGLKRFLDLEEFALDERFVLELPRHLAKSTRVLKPFTPEEMETIGDILSDEKKTISLRDRAIAEIAFGTGYRSVDIFGLTFSSFDWENDRMVFVQGKTGKCLEYPLSASIGNAVVDYLLYERPDSDSEYIFLRSNGPHEPLTSHAGCRSILKKIVDAAGIDLGDRQIGTRQTRHSRATFLLHKRVPLSIIAQSLGHRGEGSVIIYLSADEEKMASCILPIPGKKVAQ